ncbi:hypothetical protein CHU98_g12525, partial [Xylaria longipes]
DEKIKANELPAIATDEEIKSRLDEQIRTFPSTSSAWSAQSNRYTAIFDWVNNTVDQGIMTSITTKLIMNKTINLQAMVRAIKGYLAPTQSATESTVLWRYREALKRATGGGVKPETWYASWYEAFLEAQVLDLAEVKGVIATKSFLEAIRAKMAPDWARQQLASLTMDEQLGRPTVTLEQYGKVFSALVHEELLRGKHDGGGIFASLGGRSPNQSQGRGGARGGSSNRGGSRQHEGYQCPCLPNLESTHAWPPHECGRLQKAITGSSDRPIRTLSAELIKDIKVGWGYTRWSDLRKLIERSGWAVKEGYARQKQANEGAGANKWPDPNLACTVIDRSLLQQSDMAPGVYTTLGYGLHPLSESTVLDNCGALHLVNNKDLLEEGSFVLSADGDSVEAGTTSFPIIGRGRRIICNVLASAQGKDKSNLILEDVALVEGFHVNIVSEARLRDKEIWYCGLDCSLRYGSLQASVLMKELTRKHNLVFLEYSPIALYPSGSLVIDTNKMPREILSSAAGLIASMHKERPWRPSVDQPKPREDTEEVWHMRSGHLGPRALRALVEHVRGVKIKGTERVKCESCARTHASRVISQKVSERRAVRPFWRANWDLFDYPRGYDGSSWMLAIKDEYSGMIYTFTLIQKTGPQVFGTLRKFERWVKRHYKLPICKFRSDRERAVISEKGFTDFQKWAEEEGIDLELPPAYTKEPVGGGERAGQEIINRAIKMLRGAGLPERLWPEAVHAAAWLHNRSPSEAHDLRAPGEVLLTWFRQYFRWYLPELIVSRKIDLRPDWSLIWIFGCRAYPVEKDRLAGRHKRAYKVNWRAHIGYLVGYQASNLYRIWIPQLDEVITTRDVRFDEEIFYQKDQEKHAIKIDTALINDISVEPVPEDLFEIVNVWDGEPPRQNEPSADTPGESGGDSQPHDLSSGGQPEEHESGVGASEEQGKEGPEAPRDQPQGLMTPRQTPDPVGQPVRAEEQSRSAEAHGEDPSQAEEPSGSAEPQSEAPRSPQEVHLLEKEATADPLEEEDPAEDTIVVGGQPAQRKRNRKIHPTAVRASRRIRGEPPEDPEAGEGQGNAAVFTAFTKQIYGEHEISPPSDHTWLDFLGTFLPDQLEAIHQGDRKHKTLHAVFAAAVDQHKAERLGAAPQPRIHRNDLLKPPPKMWKDLAKHPLGDRFRENAAKEIANLQRLKAMAIIPRHEAKYDPLPLKWVFTYKFDEEGYLEVCKARLVVRGDLQYEDTLQSTYAATLAAKTFRIMMAIAAQFDLEVKQFDVISAFLNASREGEEPVACELPDGFKQENKAALLNRALYGLRDSPLLWYKEFASTLKSLHLIASPEEPCLFYSEDRQVYVVFYVDDFLVLYHRDHEKQAQKVINGIKRAYEVKEQGDICWFLGIRVIRDRRARKISLVHDQYIEKIALRYDLADSSWIPVTPLPFKELMKHLGEASKAQVKVFQERVGSILYTAIMIRPDVAFAAAQLSKHLTNPSQEHLAIADQVIKYLYHTRFLGITYGQAEQSAQALLIAGDASFGDDKETRRSSHGYIIFLFGGAISWKATKQSTVSTSTTEAEINVLGLTGVETIALKRLFRDIALELGQEWTIHSDNTQAIRLVVGENE